MTTSLDDTLKTVVVIKILGEHNIPCCCVGISALKFYGASRMRATWEICVPVDLVTAAEALFQSDDAFERLPPKHHCPASRIHTYSRFGTRGGFHEFLIMPDFDAHLDCRADEIVHSLRGIPYPSLRVFAQSCLDRRNQLELSDLVDGANLSEEWGEHNLDLEGLHDVAWVRTMKTKDGVSTPWWPTRPKERREIWRAFVRTKAERLDEFHPPSRFATQYRHKSSVDPWTELSDMS